MNKKQKIVLWAGIVIIVLMGLFPPTRYTVDGADWVRHEFFLLANSPVVLSNLVLCWVMVSIIAGGLIYTLKDKKPKDEQKQ